MVSNDTLFLYRIGGVSCNLVIRCSGVPVSQVSQVSPMYEPAFHRCSAREPMTFHTNDFPHGVEREASTQNTAGSETTLDRVTKQVLLWVGKEGGFGTAGHKRCFITHTH